MVNGILISAPRFKGIQAGAFLKQLLFGAYLVVKSVVRLATSVPIFSLSLNTNHIMKKIMFLFIAVCFSTVSFSAPCDINSGPRCYTRSYTDPYVTSYGAFVSDPWYSPNYAVNIQISFSQSVPAPYYAIVGMWGKWGGSTSSSYREFTILFNSGQHFKSVNFPMAFYEEAYTATADLLDYGPQ